MSWQGQWLGGWQGSWDGVLGPSDPNALAGTAYLSVVPYGTLKGAGALSGQANLGLITSGDIYGVGHLIGVSDIAVTSSGTITSAGSPSSDPRLDQILALLTGRKIYDSSTGLWRVYDAGGSELADPGGVLWRGLHGWLLYSNSVVRSSGVDYVTYARRLCRR